MYNAMYMLLWIVALCDGTNNFFQALIILMLIVERHFVRRMPHQRCLVLVRALYGFHQRGERVPRAVWRSPWLFSVARHWLYAHRRECRIKAGLPEIVQRHRLVTVR